MSDSVMVALARAARVAQRVVAKASPEVRNQALRAIADDLLAKSAEIVEANQIDLAAASSKGVTGPLFDRLKLDQRGVEKMAQQVLDIAAMPELIGRVERPETRPTGLQISRVRIPLGVIAMIYEARPNVTSDAAALCLKSGNACVLRGGSEAFHSNQAIGKVVAGALERAGLPAAAVQLVPSTDRAQLVELLAQEDNIDLCIPRGGEGLIRFVAEHSRVPVLKHYKGVCHLYVHAAANQDDALRIFENGKVQRPSACNSTETVLVDRAIAADFVPRLAAIAAERGVELRGDAEAVALASSIKPAADDDFGTEFLALVAAVRIVDGIEQAVAHIEDHGSSHTESIVTTDAQIAEQFLREVDSSTVMVNASTRFADGGELGLGAEIGISTTRMHAYGPMGAEGLTTTKFVVRGTGQIRA